MAVGAMAYLRGTAVRLPEDVAVAGFDDISSLRDITPALTTVSLPLELIGRRAIELALDDDRDGASRVPIYGVPVLRESTPLLDRPCVPVLRCTRKFLGRANDVQTDTRRR